MTKISHKRWMQSLEQERWNVANHITETRTLLIDRPCTLQHITPKQMRELEKMFYNAGRYDAGATDQTAIKAHLKYEKYEN